MSKKRTLIIILIGILGIALAISAVYQQISRQAASKKMLSEGGLFTIHVTWQNWAKLVEAEGIQDMDTLRITLVDGGQDKQIPVKFRVKTEGGAQEITLMEEETDSILIPRGKSFSVFSRFMDRGHSGTVQAFLSLSDSQKGLDTNNN